MAKSSCKPLTHDLILVAQRPTAINDGEFQVSFENNPPSPARALQETLSEIYAPCAAQPCRRAQDQQEQIDYWKRLATTDELTDLNNRRGLNLVLEEEQQRLHDGTSQGGVILFVDMDGFKSINDRFGHEWGDRCLKLAGSVLNGLQSLIRETDIISVSDAKTETAARFGGDEFVMILRDTTRDMAQDRIDQITRQLNSMHIYIPNGRQPIDIDTPEDTYTAKIRASVGAFEYKQGDNLSDVLKQADMVMYNTKQARKAAAAENSAPHIR